MNVDRPLVRIILLVIAIVLFILGGLGAIDWIEGVNESAMVCFGLAAFAGSAL